MYAIRSYYVQDRHHRLEIALRGGNHPARAHHRLGKEAGDGVGAFLDDRRLEFGGKARGELLLGLSYNFV